MHQWGFFVFGSVSLAVSETAGRMLAEWIGASFSALLLFYPNLKFCTVNWKASFRSISNSAFDC
jgi:hypothetical protein